MATLVVTIWDVLAVGGPNDFGTPLLTDAWWFPVSVLPFGMPLLGASFWFPKSVLANEYFVSVKNNGKASVNSLQVKCQKTWKHKQCT